MNFYDEKILANIRSERFSFIEWDDNNHVLTITLDREEKRNALHPQMVNEIAFLLNYANRNNKVWIVVIQAKGKIFCAGADLKAFAGEIGEFDSTIPQPNHRVLLGELFQQVHKPIITKLEGDVYAGGLFFVAGSNFVVANDKVNFSLPEVKRGIFPFQVMKELLKVMTAREVVNWCILGENLDAKDAFTKGLITDLTEEDQVQQRVEEIIINLKENSPSAIRLGLQAFEEISKEEGKHEYLMGMLQQTIQSKDGKEGILAFKEKRSPVWTGE